MAATVVSGLSFVTDGLSNPQGILADHAQSLGELQALISLLRSKASADATYSQSLSKMADASSCGSHIPFAESTSRTALHSLVSQVRNTSSVYGSMAREMQEHVLPSLTSQYHERMRKGRAMNSKYKELERALRHSDKEFEKSCKNLNAAFNKASDLWKEAMAAGIEAEAVWTDYCQKQKNFGSDIVPTPVPQKNAIQRMISPKRSEKRNKAAAWLLAAKNKHSKELTLDERLDMTSSAILESERWRNETRKKWEDFKQGRIMHLRRVQLLLAEYQLEKEKWFHLIEDHLRTVNIHEVNALRNLTYDWKQIQQDFEKISFDADMRIWRYNTWYPTVYVSTSTSFLFKYPRKVPQPPLAAPLKQSDFQCSVLPITDTHADVLLGVIATRQESEYPGLPIVSGQQAASVVSKTFGAQKNAELLLPPPAPKSSSSEKMISASTIIRKTV